jgi:SAM-dependent methyltransferase
MDTMPQMPILIPATLDLTNQGRAEGLQRVGFAPPEPHGSWTNSQDAQLIFAVDPAWGGDILMTLEIAAFLHPSKLTEQRITASINGVSTGTWTIREPGWHQRPIILPAVEREGVETISLGLAIPTSQAPSELGIGADTRRLGIIVRRILFSAMPAAPAYVNEATTARFTPGRRVGNATRRTYDEKIGSGFWARYVTGPRVLDIGCKGNDAAGVPLDEGAGLPLIETAIGVDLDYPGYDGRTLPFPSESQDAVYSSNCLEHIPDYIKAIQEWYRVLKMGGHIIVVVPHAHLYERRRRPPSRWNLGHVRTYTAASLLAEFEAALEANSYRVRHVYEDDRGYRYDDPPDRHGTGGYEIELVIEKIKPPAWRVED